MPAAYPPPLIVTFPGGIGDPSAMRIPTSGGRRMGCAFTRKNRRMGCGLMRKNSRRSTRRMGCGLMRKNRRRRNTRR